jgi:hypothetical protein
MAYRTSIVAATAIGAAALAIPASPSSAQQPAAGAIGEARSLSAWEWAIGRWEGHLLMSAGSKSPVTSTRLLLIDRDSSGGVTCRFLVPPPSERNVLSNAIPSDAGLTKRCVIRPDGISLTTDLSGDLELIRSGPDELHGAPKMAYARGTKTQGLAGIQVRLTRLR